MFTVENRGFQGICLHLWLSLPSCGQVSVLFPAGAALPECDLCLSTEMLLRAPTEHLELHRFQVGPKLLVIL